MKPHACAPVHVAVLMAVMIGAAGCGATGNRAGGVSGSPPSTVAAEPAMSTPLAASAPSPGLSAAPANSQASRSTPPEPAPAIGTSVAGPVSGARPVGGGGTNPAPAVAARPAPGEEPAALKFAQLYASVNIEEGLKLSDKVKALNGHRVTMTGYMAPPLKPSLDFFVLTKQPMAICPFCSSDADWPNDIILILVKGSQDAVLNTTPVKVTGVLEAGGKTDPQTGFYSILRIYAESVKEVK